MKPRGVKYLSIHVGNFVVPCILWKNTNSVSFYDPKIPILKMEIQPTREDIRKHLIKYI